MVTTVYIAAALIVSAPPVAGVVRGGASVRPPEGGLVALGNSVRTGKKGWAELQVVGVGRVRLFPGTEVQVAAGPRLRLHKGRLWLQAERTVPLLVRGESAVVRRGASAIVEDTRTGGVLVAVRSGEVFIGAARVTAGYVWRRPAVGPARPPRRGGDELADLLRGQMRRLIGDWTGLEAWLLAEVDRAKIGPAQGLTPAGVARGEQEAAPGTRGVLAETALRPPPFFEEEVPPRGPNTRIEVEFSED